MKKPNTLVVISGIAVGLAAVLLSRLGNPGNMGFCIACFLRDMAGSLGLHRASAVQYFRPEIVGMVVGAMVMALIGREWKARGGSAPAIRFLLGMVVMVGALMFLGCPLRMMIRLGSGDWNALIALLGFVAGILVGVCFLKRGFTLRRSYSQTPAEGAIVPVLFIVGLLLSLAVPALFLRSAEGPGAQAAPWVVALLCGLLVGALAQKSRLCMVGGIRDAILFRDFHLLWGFAALTVTVIAANLLLHQFHPGFLHQPVAHTDGLWNFLGMAVVGWSSVLLGGCPMRQLILTGEGNSDSAVTVLGMVAGAALCHNWNLAASPKGPTVNGQIAVTACLVLLLVLSVLQTKGRRNLT